MFTHALRFASSMLVIRYLYPRANTLSEIVNLTMIYSCLAGDNAIPSPSPKRAATDSAVKVPTTKNTKQKRTWDKKDFCFFCRKLYSKLWRHQQKSHKNEPEVAVVECQDKESRPYFIARLRNMGNHIYNSEVLQSRKGTLILGYRPSYSVEPDEYAPCEFCYKYLIRTDLWRHRCFFRKKETKGKKRVAASSKLMLPVAIDVSRRLKLLLASSRVDDVSVVIKADKLIISLGEKLINGQPEEKEADNYIRATLRRVAKLLMLLRQKDSSPNASLMEFIKPSHFRSIVSAVKELAGCDGMGFVKTPSLALKYGHDLKKCSTICISQALERGDSPTDAENFHRLLDMNWSSEMSKNALRTMKVGKQCSTL